MVPAGRAPVPLPGQLLPSQHWQQSVPGDALRMRKALWRGAAAQLCKERLVLLLFRHTLAARHKNYLINPSPRLASQAGWRLPTQFGAEDDKLLWDSGSVSSSSRAGSCGGGRGLSTLWCPRGQQGHGEGSWALPFLQQKGRNGIFSQNLARGGQAGGARECLGTGLTIRV